MKSEEEIAEFWGMTVRTGPQIDCPDCGSLHGRLEIRKSGGPVSLWCKSCQRTAKMMTKTLCLLQEAWILGYEAAQAEMRAALGIEEDVTDRKEED